MVPTRSDRSVAIGGDRRLSVRPSKFHSGAATVVWKEFVPDKIFGNGFESN